VVRRPLDTGRFNGTVAVEWLNVSAGTDAEPDWACTHRHLIREGFAWVGVSVQKAGIDGGGIADGPHLKSVDHGRYKLLSHPGDAFSYDIFSQVGRVLRDSRGRRPLGSLSPARLIAMGGVARSGRGPGIHPGRRRGGDQAAGRGRLPGVGH
jgi:alpha/beta hydrolase family protein